jgi:hypothetical protein
MKNILKTVLVLFTLFSVGCSKKDDDKIDYYLSQPRDTDLFGWWTRIDETGSYYWHFQQTGRIFEVHYSSPSDIFQYDDKYWFVENKEGKNILNVFEKHGGLYGSIEYQSYYKVVNDTLWTSNGIEEYSNDTELKILWLKTTAPQY